MPRQRIQCLQVYRGLAALGVVLHHTPRRIIEDSGLSSLDGLFHFGEIGVDFFFVLSGYLIFSIHRKDFGVAASVPRYAAKRILRIYPLVFVACLIKLAAILVIGGEDLERKLNPYYLVSSFLLLPVESHWQYLIGLMWTLSHEMFFYLLFIIPIIFGFRAAVIGGLAWAALIVMMNVGEGNYGPEALPAAFVARPCNLAFLFGCGTALLPSLAGRTRALASVTVLSVAALLLGIFVLRPLGSPDFNVGPTDLAHRIIWAPICALVLYASIQWENARGIRFPAIALLIGNASYSIYLFHSSALHVAGPALFRFIGPDPSLGVRLAGLGVLLASAIGAGLAAYFLFERPAARWATRWIDRRFPRVAAA